MQYLAHLMPLRNTKPYMATFPHPVSHVHHTPGPIRCNPSNLSYILPLPKFPIRFQRSVEVLPNLENSVRLSPDNLSASLKPLKVMQHVTFPTQILLIPPTLALKCSIRFNSEATRYEYQTRHILCSTIYKQCSVIR